MRGYDVDDYADDMTFREAWWDLTPVEKVRFVVGVIARSVFWACFWFILGNAVMQAINDSRIFLAIVELVAFPITVLVYPLAASEGVMAWPFADGISFIPFWLAMIVGYPISTFVGGMPPVD